MTIEIFEGLEPLTPLDLFSVGGTLCRAEKTPSCAFLRKQGALADTSLWLLQENFATVFAAWNPSGLFVLFSVDKPFEEALYPKYRQGDSVELFVDTRPLTSSRQITAFCHHFVFLPQAVQEVSAQEVTKFRGEGNHPLCSPEELEVERTFSKRGYEMWIHIPASCLYGFDPSEFDHVGLSYRINGYRRAPQLFSDSSDHFPLESHPFLWATFTLK